MHNLFYLIYYIIQHSDSETRSTQEFSDDTQQCLIEAMEAIITDLQEEVQTLKVTVDKLNAQISTYKSIHHSDLINKILVYIYNSKYKYSH